MPISLVSLNSSTLAAIQGVHRAKTVGQDRGHSCADMADRQRVQEPGQAAILAGFDAVQQVVDDFRPIRSN